MPCARPIRPKPAAASIAAIGALAARDEPIVRIAFNKGDPTSATLCARTWLCQVPLAAAQLLTAVSGDGGAVRQEALLGRQPPRLRLRQCGVSPVGVSSRGASRTRSPPASWWWTPPAREPSISPTSAPRRSEWRCACRPSSCALAYGFQPGVFFCCWLLPSSCLPLTLNCNVTIGIEVIARPRPTPDVSGSLRWGVSLKEKFSML